MLENEIFFLNDTKKLDKKLTELICNKLFVKDELCDCRHLQTLQPDRSAVVLHDAELSAQVIHSYQ